MSWGLDIGIDLGTATVLVYVRGKGIVVNEPSVVAIDSDTGRVLAIGEEARKMIGRTPGNIIAIRPLREGVIADYSMTETMLKYFLSRVCGKTSLVRPRLMVCVPSGITSVEKRAVIEAAIQAGASKAFLIEEPLAAALGSGLDITGPKGHMVVDVGGGTTDIAVISLGGIVLSESIRVAGDKLDEGIIKFVRKEYNLMIGERTAEEIKMTIGSVYPNGRDESMDVRGRDLVTGLPKTIKITSEETRLAMEEPIEAIVDRIKAVLERTPPELAGDIIDHGIMLTGGGATVYGLDKLVTKRTGVTATLADNPVSCVALGTGKALEYSDVNEHYIQVMKKVM